jgi:hypothetical protein
MWYDATTKEIRYDSAKTFVIDHPVDNSRYLVHACLEGPESGVYYRGVGNITFGDSVIVNLPNYVDSLATDFTVSLTPIGRPRVLGASRVKNGKFEVYCLSNEQCEFYWTVFAKRGNIVVEPTKSESIVHGDGPYRWIN